MEIKIGVQNLPRELALDTNLDAAEVTKRLTTALGDGGVLELTDDRGRVVIVPAAAIGYLEIGPEETRRVGFGSL